MFDKISFQDYRKSIQQVDLDASTDCRVHNALELFSNKWNL
ncbi:hypothetical protein K420107F6_43620 [Lactonifactor longoviformis]